MNGMRSVWTWGVVALVALRRLADAGRMIVGNDQEVSWDDAGKQFGIGSKKSPWLFECRWPCSVDPQSMS
jgi:hypothetical protein